MLGLVTRLLYYSLAKLKITACTRLLRHHVECGLRPLTRKNQKKSLETLLGTPGRFIKSNYYCTTGTVTRLKELQLSALSDIWRAAHLILVYKIINNYIDIPSDHCFPPDTLFFWSRNKSFIASSCRLNIFKSFFKDLSLNKMF